MLHWSGKQDQVSISKRWENGDSHAHEISENLNNWRYLGKVMTQIENCRMKCPRYHLCKPEVTKYVLRYKNMLLTSHLYKSIKT